MPMDEYDIGHYAEYCETINIYQNSDIYNVVAEFMKNIGNKQNIDSLKKDIIETITRAQEALNVLDNRKITLIGSRVCHAYLDNGEAKYDWYLVNVWRAYDGSY